jgi:hypothetical protein
LASDKVLLAVRGGDVVRAAMVGGGGGGPWRNGFDWGLEVGQSFHGENGAVHEVRGAR